MKKDSKKIEAPIVLTADQIKAIAAGMVMAGGSTTISGRRPV